MDQANGSRSDRYGPQPPPYNPYDDGRISYTGKTYQVGKGGITVVTPPGSYDNMVYLEGQAAAVGPAPPNYSPGLEDSVFADGAIRRGFIRKVYLTLMIQLLVTVGIISAFLYWDALKEWTRTNSWFTYAMMPTVMVLLVLLSCCDNIRRRVPLNFITLGVFTIAEGLMLGSLAVGTSPWRVEACGCLHGLCFRLHCSVPSSDRSLRTLLTPAWAPCCFPCTWCLIPSASWAASTGNTRSLPRSTFTPPSASTWTLLPCSYSCYNSSTSVADPQPPRQAETLCL
ncbi:protein lifeguard 3 isoform X2 [Entelurus aequoreus]|uniref:protein lifeguard 3 isoform X2 n=1 Tax=Entelurus aequoreus TaxID=161455 RepID=UPI002B1DE5B3|nr:protein lifeguard 3 isoform X2 [Entelurus aequoreus]